MNQENQKHNVFISYSTRNSDIANRICYLLEKNGLKCWIAPRNISSGKIYIEEIGDAIRSTKIVVLVYSSFSQASRYVNNEIEMAYSYNKPIISFNIDNAEPRDEMAYFLKVSQWLPAFPDPEAEYETLIKDALHLCNEKNDAPILTDLTNYQEEDMTRHKKDYLSLILLFTPVYWASFIYMGLTSHKRLWTVMGLVYLIPSIMILLLEFEVMDFLFILHAILNLFILIFFLLWAIAIIHGILIRNEFLTRKSILRFTFSDEKLFEYLYEEYIQL
ncbi:toll/interleukin-1 receptor domain-containing protein [uncultured Methanobrevibacter sp.]|uniref:toll/interleukin-1 receptor domain-containing protein n=1 Tax=uncultured Methanobrevibacter sp. TaxID=253161 RepID=UPI0025E2D12B|nr:toll/interleukin-1 receptor domain-containing protein [uncultured Methanobrevibacter sp.]